MLDELKQLIALLCKYLENTNAGMNTMEVLVEYIFPTVSTLIVVASAVAAVYKYYHEKNRTYYERILNEVYAPLYQYIIRQEFFRKDHESDLPMERYPIISLTNTKTKNKISFEDGTIKSETETEKKELINSKELLEVKETLNFGLVPQDLMVLLNAYEMLYKLKRSSEEKESIAILSALRKNIIEGYYKYRKKLDMKDCCAYIEYNKETSKLDFDFVSQKK